MSQLGFPLANAVAAPVEVAPGAIWVPGWLDVEAQLELVDAFRVWAAPPAGLRRPSMPNGAPFSTSRRLPRSGTGIPTVTAVRAMTATGAPVKAFPPSLAATRPRGLRCDRLRARGLRRRHRQSLRGRGEARPAPGQDRGSRGPGRRLAGRDDQPGRPLHLPFRQHRNGRAGPTPTSSWPAATSSCSAGRHELACPRRAQDVSAARPTRSLGLDGRISLTIREVGQSWRRT